MRKQSKSVGPTNKILNNSVSCKRSDALDHRRHCNPRPHKKLKKKGYSLLYFVSFSPIYTYSVNNWKIPFGELRIDFELALSGLYFESNTDVRVSSLVSGIFLKIVYFSFRCSLNLSHTVCVSLF